MLLETLIIGGIMWGGFFLHLSHVKEVDRLKKQLDQKDEIIFQLDKKLSGRRDKI